MVFFRYFYLKGSTWLHTNEVELSDASDNNVARYAGVVASAASIWATGFEASNAIDGNNTYSSFYHSGSNVGAYLQIDLGQQYDIRKIRIYNEFTGSFGNNDVMQPRMSGILMMGFNDTAAITDASKRIWYNNFDTITTARTSPRYWDYTLSVQVPFTNYVTSPFGSWPYAGITGIALSSDETRVVISEYYAKKLWYRTYNGSSWSSYTSITGAEGIKEYIQCGLTSDGNRGVAIAANIVNGTGGLCYFFTWNGTGYSSFTQTLDSNSRVYWGLDITPDGSRIVASGAGRAYFANWNGTNYSAFTATGETTNATGGIGISADGTKIAYTNSSSRNVYWASWNGTNYGTIKQITGTPISGTSTNIKFSSDGNVIFHILWSSTTFQYSIWNGSEYLPFVNAPTTALPTNIEPYGLQICPNGSIYMASFSPIGIYKTTFSGGGLIAAPSQVAPTISFSIPAKTFGTDVSFNLAPSSNSDGAFSYISSNTAVATISGSTITILGAGSSTITATQASTTNYLQGTATATLSVAQALSTFGFRYFYIKKRTDTNDYLSVPEIELYDASNNNVARNTGVVATARTTYNDSTATQGPQLAINGILIGGSGNGYSSNLSNDEWLKIDLLQQYDIRKVRVYINFQSEYFLQTRLSNALLIGSNDETNNALTDSSLRYWSGQMPSINITTHPNTNYMDSTYLDFSVPALPLNRLVAVGSGNNTIIYSDNGTSWTGLGVSIFIGGAGHSVASNGTMWVAVGEGSSNTMGYSTNGGASWTGLGKTMFQSGSYGIASNGTMWVAGGNGTNNTLAYSSDGITWYGLGKTIFSTSASGIATNGTMWIATGSGTNTLAYSYNGTTWSGIGTSIFASPRGGICWFNNKWIVAGDNSIGYSSDGINWTKVYPSFITSRAWGVGTNGVMCIVMCEGTSTMGYSNDGINWTGLGNTIFTPRGRGVAWSGTKWIAVGEGNSVAWSNDGITWSGLGNTLFTSSGRFVAAGTYISQANPTISFSIPAKTFGTDVSFNLAPSSNSTGAFTFTSSNTAVATVSGSTITIIGVGSSIITLTQAATINYLQGTATASLNVGQGLPNISFSIPAKTFGTDVSFNLAPSSNSTGAFTFTSSHSAVATVSGSTITIRGAGTTTITAIQDETTNYFSRIVTTDLTVNQAIPTINFSIPVKTFGTPAFNLDPNSNSTGVFTFTSSNPLVATVSGSTVTIIKAGSTTISLIQDATTNYLEGSSSAVLTINKVVTLLTGVSNIVTSFADIFTLEYNSNSDGALSYVFSDPDIATIFGSTVTATKVGSTTITVTQAETENYFSDTLSFVLTVNKADPSLSNFVNIENTYGDASFNIVAPITFSSGAFTYVSSNIAVAVVSDSTVTIVGAGTTTITATQETTDYYLQDSITCLLTVNKASPLLSIFEYITKTYGDPPFNIITPTSLSSGAFTYSSSNSSRAIVVDDVITIVKAGFVAIIVTQEETDNYFSETTYGILAIYKQDTHLSVFEDIVKTYGDGDFDLLEPQSSRLGYYTYISSNESVAVIVNNTVTIHSGGVTTIMAIQDETETHKQGLITCSLKIHRINSTLNYIDVLLIDGSYKIKVDTNSTGLFTYSVSDSTVVTINEDNTLSFLQPGDVTIIATQSETASYYSGEFSTIVSYTGA